VKKDRVIYELRAGGDAKMPFARGKESLARPIKPPKRKKAGSLRKKRGYLERLLKGKELIKDPFE